MAVYASLVLVPVASKAFGSRIKVEYINKSALRKTRKSLGIYLSRDERAPVAARMARHPKAGSCLVFDDVLYCRKLTISH